MNPLFHTEFSISDSLKNVRKSVLIYETIIRSTGASAVYGGSNGDTIGKGGAANGAAFYRGIFEGVLEEQTRGD